MLASLQPQPMTSDSMGLPSLPMWPVQPPTDSFGSSTLPEPGIQSSSIPENLEAPVTAANTLAAEHGHENGGSHLLSDGTPVQALPHNTSLAQELDGQFLTDRHHT